MMRSAELSDVIYMGTNHALTHIDFVFKSKILHTFIRSNNNEEGPCHLLNNKTN